MTLDNSPLRDEMTAAGGYNREGTDDRSFVRGTLNVVLTGPDGGVKYDHTVKNIITQVGEQRYGEAGALGTSASVPQPTGMALGTGTTTASKTGAGAALVTPTTGSAIALTGNPSSSLAPTTNYRRVTYVCSWGAGTATATGIAEVVLQNGTATTMPTAGDGTKILARALLSPTVNKGAADTLTITWSHDVGSG